MQSNCRLRDIRGKEDMYDFILCKPINVCLCVHAVDKIAFNWNTKPTCIDYIKSSGSITYLCSVLYDRGRVV